MTKELKQVVILFAGDSGDGMQLTGSQFTNTSAHIGNDISTFPDFPAEIRAPGGTIAGVSGFQLNFGSISITSPGDGCDVLVAMNAAALIKNKPKLNPNGIIIANSDGFNAKNLKLAKAKVNPLEEAKKQYKVYEIDISGQTTAALKDSSLGVRDKDRTKNMFALGFVYWLYNRPLDYTIQFLNQKFIKKPNILNANLKVLKAGYHFGEISDTFTERFEVKPAQMPKGKYRNITGNHALAIGLVAAAQKANLDLFYGGYPITPASDILHYLAKYKSYNVKTFQAEDEIAAMASVIGASYAGDLAVTASSGPGIALKTEAIGLALMLEIPAVIVNVQRGGPSTGLPTKTEQADLLQAVYGRNGEAPVVVVAAKSPKDCFYMAFEACRIAVEHMTPVMLLSDGYLGNGSEPWRFPQAKNLKEISTKKPIIDGEKYMPYIRDENGVRGWAIPGMKGLEHRVGGLEKQNITGDVSYDPNNHEFMIKQRAEKVEKVKNFIPNAIYENGSENSELLVIGWGSTYGSIKAAIAKLKNENIDIAHIQLNYINPFPKNLGEIIKNHKKIVIPEINQGQLVKIIRDKYLVDAKSITKTKGTPFTANEIYESVKNILFS